ncbi:uncharacterized protein MONBRDRAFT_27399 [Monosiga brevicollis MX1]|uniref:Clusterin-associated protein 1 n=1 Tax=Monosiga brevicollis TaxID=81824 RepID=A9V562_MONBE|nr:uncharacterized protein MONBRDRAFT_27399 [Monosiga brevicollis MX1]EDQ87219.1 predicted protein [Monosiga brevicollis MX1]|eukprot:XP_001747832.1 hypothetical protein [Monosiga brevicollis MX1]
MQRQARHHIFITFKRIQLLASAVVDVRDDTDLPSESEREWYATGEAQRARHAVNCQKKREEKRERERERERELSRERELRERERETRERFEREKERRERDDEECQTQMALSDNMMLVGITSELSSEDASGLAKLTGIFMLIAFFVLYPNNVAQGLGLSSECLFRKFLPNPSAFFFDHHVAWWSHHRWTNHPACRHLRSYSPDWLRVARAINAEACHMDRVQVQVGTRTILITDSWLVQCNVYSLDIALQANVDMSVVQAWEIHSIHSNEARQMLRVHVTSVNAAVKPFNVVLDSLQYGILRDKLSVAVRMVQNIQLRVSVADRFLHELRQIVEENPPYLAPPSQMVSLCLLVQEQTGVPTHQPISPDEGDQCIGCLNAQPNIKIQTNSADESLGACYCRPMWCLDCLGKGVAVGGRERERGKAYFRATRCGERFSAPCKMSYRDLRNFTEMLRALGYPRLVSIENFRQPNFPLVAEILVWLLKKFDRSAAIPLDIDTEADRVIFIKAIAAFMATKAHVRLNTRRLYGADGYAVREMLKVTSLIYSAARQAAGAPGVSSGAPPVSLSDFDINTKLGDLKQTRMLAGEITSRGANLYELLENEPELRANRSRVLASGMDIEQIEQAVRTSLQQLRMQTEKINGMMNNIAADEANLEGKLEKKRLDLDRNQKRLKSLQSVRPAFMDEYEKLEGELQTSYEEYVEKYRNLAYLEKELEDFNQREQDKFQETERQLRRMQDRLHDEEARLMRGGEDGTLDLDEDDDDEDLDYNDGLLDEAPDSDEELERESSRYQRHARQAAAFGDMGAGLEDDDDNSDVDLSASDGSELTDDAEEDLLTYKQGDEVLDDTDDDDF